jgi:TetR/AcrR family transcriptional repressor of nem operon
MMGQPFNALVSTGAGHRQPPPAQNASKTRLLNAALHLIRSKGYASTAVDDICHEAGVTKGSFFHHFKSKDDLALAAVAHWRTMTEGFFASATYHQAPDPLDRLLGYLDFRAAILTGELADYTCLLGTLVQETYATHPEIRAACEQALSAHIAELTRDVEAARQLYAANASWSAQSVGNFIQAVLQGSFIFAKAEQSPEVIRENLEHLRRSLRALFQPDGHVQSKKTERPPKASYLFATKQEAPTLSHRHKTEEQEEYDSHRSHYTD